MALTYAEALDYLDSFVDYERRIPGQAARTEFSTDNIARFLNELGSPQLSYPTLHVAGTKGKGSVCAFAESILRASGLKTGLYTSPHMVEVRERIRLGGEMIPEEDFASLLSDILPLLEREREARGSPPEDSGIRRLTYFEILTYLAFERFRRSRVDAAVIEVGMGGRLDATNVVAPAACAVTNVSFDHTRELGGTLREIASEKAGILKRRVPVVVERQRPEALAAIESRAEALGCPLVRLGTEVGFKGSWREFEVRTPRGKYKGLRSSLMGARQVENAACAIALVEEAAARTEWKLTPDAVRRALSATVWPGRMELFSERPRVFLDGAHNVESLKVALRTAREEGGEGRLVVVFGVSSDKDTRGMLRLLDSSADDVIFTTSGHPRAEDPAMLARVARFYSLKGGGGGGEEPDALVALERARAQAGPDGTVLVTGSFYLLGALEAERGR